MLELFYLDEIFWLKIKTVSTTMTISMVFLWIVRLIHRVINRRLAIKFRYRSPESLRRTKTIGAVIVSFIHFLAFYIIIINLSREFNFSVQQVLVSFGLASTALAFGAQNVIKDFCVGFLLVIENQFGVGDIISISHRHIGTVELMTLRSTVIRDLEGRAHHISNGYLTDVIVFSKEFTKAIVDVEISQHENIIKVTGALQKIGVELAAKMDTVVEPTTILGIESMHFGICVIRTVTKTQPGKQWVVARELRRLIILRFTEEGFLLPVMQNVSFLRPDNDY